MIASLHGAMGAACGAITGSRSAAAFWAVVAHFALDTINHEEPRTTPGNLRTELIALDATLLGVAVLALITAYGPASPQVVGILAGSLPDLEHLVVKRKRARLHTLLPHAVSPTPAITLRSQVGLAAAVFAAQFAWWFASELRRRPQAR